MEINESQGLSVGVVGLGLIGGSMAKALQKYTTYQIYGWDIDSQTAQMAVEQGAVDRLVPPQELGSCQVILTAMYPQQTVNFVKENLVYFQKGTILMDLCGVKRYLVDQLTDLCGEAGVTFIGGHPMAGKECWGFADSNPDLFQKASMIVTPDERTPKDALSFMENLFLQIGFGRITRTTAADHDSMIAFTSQLAHIVSSAYIKSPRAQKHAGFSAGSYKDLTRVAKLNPQMWTELFLENQDDLIDEIDEIIVHLDEYREAIANHDGERLYQLLDEGRRIKEELDQ